MRKLTLSMLHHQQKMVAAEVVAEILGVTPATILRWFHSRQIPGIRISKQTIRFRVDEVLRAIRQESGISSVALSKQEEQQHGR